MDIKLAPGIVCHDFYECYQIIARKDAAEALLPRTALIFGVKDEDYYVFASSLGKKIVEWTLGGKNISDVDEGTRKLYEKMERIEIGTALCFRESFCVVSRFPAEGCLGVIYLGAEKILYEQHLASIRILEA